MALETENGEEVTIAGTLAEEVVAVRTRVSRVEEGDGDGEGDGDRDRDGDGDGDGRADEGDGLTLADDDGEEPGFGVEEALAGDEAESTGTFKASEGGCALDCVG